MNSLRSIVRKRSQEKNDSFNDEVEKCFGGKKLAYDLWVNNKPLALYDGKIVKQFTDHCDKFEKWLGKNIGINNEVRLFVVL